MDDAATQSVEVQTGHVGLNVTDLARSVRFYSNVFGLQVFFRCSAPAGMGTPRPSGIM